MRSYLKIYKQVIKFIFIPIIILLNSCRSHLDNTIKKGYFDNCSKANVETLIQNFFGNPKWDSFIGNDDQYHLNISGQIEYNNIPANALIQFEITEGDRWQINSFSINGTPQDAAVITELINEMCNSLDNKSSNKNQESLLNTNKTKDELTGNNNSVLEDQTVENSIDGIYTYEDQSVKLSITIMGDSWSGETTILTGLGEETDSQNTEFDQGVIKGNDLYESSGLVKVGFVHGNTLNTTIGDKNVVLRK